MQTRQRQILVDSFKDVKSAANGLIIGGVQAPGPAVLGQDADDSLEFAVHLARQFRSRFAKVLEIRSREHQHLTGPIMPKIVIALPVLGCLGPVQKVFPFRFGLSRKEARQSARSVARRRTASG